MSLCSYNRIFGEPRKDFHSIRIPILDIALLDTLGTIFFAYILSFYCLKRTKYNFFIILFILFILAIFSHYIFCVKTKINSLLFN